jgi:hypothetical protein
LPKKISAEIYPNSPLVEVIFEIRFSGEPIVECRRDISPTEAIDDLGKHIILFY